MKVIECSRATLNTECRVWVEWRIEALHTSGWFSSFERFRQFVPIVFRDTDVHLLADLSADVNIEPSKEELLRRIAETGTAGSAQANGTRIPRER